MHKSMLKRLLLMAVLAGGLLNPRPAAAQTISYTGGNFTENFDSMGPAGTNLPPGWFVGYAAGTILSQVFPSDGSIAPNGTAGWNFGLAGAADRSPGLAATSTGTPPPPAASRYLEARFRNNSGFPFMNVTVFYDGEQWRTGQGSTVNTLVLQVSGDGVNFVNMGAAFDFTQPTFTPFDSALDGNQATNRAPGRGGIFTLPSPLPPGGTLFLRWFDMNDAGTDPALAIDNFSFSATAVAPPPSVALTSVAPLTGPPGVNVTATASVTNGSGQVDFYLDGQLVFQDTASPFTVVYGDLTAGVHDLTAVAYGSGAVRATSAPVIVAITNETENTYLVPNGTVWKYLDTGADLSNAWFQVNFDDTAWASGPAELGFGDRGDNPPRPERTVINGGPATNRNTTTYFRHTFTVADPAAYSGFLVRLLRDDGGVAYLNGVEVFRSNIDPTNPIVFTNMAFNAVDDGTEYFSSTNLSPALLVAGQNLLAVEIHQSSITSSDLSFDAMLLAQPVTGKLVRKVYRGIPGNLVSDLTSHPKFINDQPDEVTYVSSFEDTTPSDQLPENENFGVQLSGFLIPPVTGNYDFFIAGDNESTLYLSVDESPAHKILIAREPEWNVQRDWLGTDRRDTNAPQNRSTTLFSGGISLVAGQHYYIEALSKEGEIGNHVSVTWQVPGEPAVTNGTPPIPGIGTFVNLAGTHTVLSALPYSPGYYPCCPAGATMGPELVINPNFSAGNTGFTSDYLLLFPICSPGLYTVATSLSVGGLCNNWACIDHTIGSATGNFFVADGSQTLGQAAWRQQVILSPSTSYSFCAWVNNLNEPVLDRTDPIVEVWLVPASGPAVLLASSGALPESPDNWVQISASWTSPAAVSNPYRLEFRTAATSFEGNNFALDDISFRACSPQPPCVQCPPLNQTITGCPPVVPDYTKLNYCAPPNGPLTVTQNPAAGTVLPPGQTVVVIHICNATGQCRDCDVIINAVYSPGCYPCCPAGATMGPELVINPNFSAGNTGFTSDYLLLFPICSPGLYTVATSLSVGGLCNNWACIDHTIGSATGNFFVADGSQTLGQAAWRQQVILSPSTSYSFCAWVNNLNEPVLDRTDPIVEVWLVPASGPAVLLASSGALPESPDNWVQISASWTSPAAVSNPYRLEFRTAATSFEGNNFALDDISFRACSPQPPCVQCPPLNQTITGCPPVVPDYTKLNYCAPPNGPLTVTQNPAAGTVLPPGQTVVVIHICNATGQCRDCDVIINAVYLPGCYPCCPSGATLGPELVINPNFSAGNTGFTSDYLLLSPICSPGLYTVATSLSVGGLCNNWACLDHTIGSATGNFFVADGSQTLGQAAWRQQVILSPSTSYSFCAWVNNLNEPVLDRTDPIVEVWLVPASGPAVLLASSGALPESPDNWVQISASWTSPAAVSNPYRLEFRTAATSFEGNNFALDDITFRACSPQTPYHLTIAAAGSNIVLSWPVEATNFNLEETVHLQGTNTAWTTITSTPIIVESNKQVTLPSGAGVRFYRLRGPGNPNP